MEIPKFDLEAGDPVFRWYGPSGDEQIRITLLDDGKAQISSYNFDTEMWDIGEYSDIHNSIW